MDTGVANLKKRYGQGRVRIPAQTRVRLEDGGLETLKEDVRGRVRGWEVMTSSSGKKLELLVVLAGKRRLRVAASRVELLPVPPPVRFPRLRPSNLAR